MHRHTQTMLSAALVLLCLAASASHANDAYDAAWGPAVGAMAPPIIAPDQTGAERDLDSIAAENGVLFLFNRSADW